MLLAALMAREEAGKRERLKKNEKEDIFNSKYFRIPPDIAVPWCCKIIECSS